MLKLVILALIQSTFLSFGQIILKLALAAAGPFSWTWKFFRAQLVNWWWPACGAVFGVATVLWFYILRHYPLSIAYPLSCISYAIGVLGAVLIFHEQVSWTQWVGVALIMLGCALVAK